LNSPAANEIPESAMTLIPADTIKCSRRSCQPVFHQQKCRRLQQNHHDSSGNYEQDASPYFNPLHKHFPSQTQLAFSVKVYDDWYLIGV
jgi:hypothetical protein